MAAPLIQHAFTTGEVSPSLYGRFDLARMHTAASTCRNCFVSYKGGAYSRAGTKFVGFSKQTGRNFPPRNIPFQFSINQGLDLEFGHEYMRVISDGAFVTETPIPISNISNTDPATVTAPGIGVVSATANDGAVTATYAPGDQVTLAGGAYTAPAVLGVTDTTLVSLSLNSPGSGVYAPADTVNLTGGTQTVPAQLVVSTTQVVSATVAAGGTGGTAGTQTVTGTTGGGTRFQASVTVSGGGAITAVLAITVAGDYTLNPTTPAMEPVTGAGLAGAKLDVSLGILTFAIFAGGTFTANPAGGAFTQASTSGSGTGATFQSAILGPNDLSVVTPGTYSVFPANPVAQLGPSTSGGLGATYNVATASVGAFVNGDWVEIDGVMGMPQVNGQTYVIGGVGGDTFNLFDVYGNPIDATAFGVYSGGGTVARIFTLVTPWQEQDLKYLKFTQSADVMSICCVNQMTNTEYEPRDLARLSDTSWTLLSVVPKPTVLPPAAVPTLAASSGGTTNYAYVVTSVDPQNGTESIASPPGTISGSVDIASTAGTIKVTWGSVGGVNLYNIYKATPNIGSAVPIGATFGFAGFAYGTQFIDGNIVADFAQTPPLHKNPFAQGQIVGAKIIASGTGYTQAGVAYTINSATGSGAIFTPVIVGGGLSALILVDGGQDYKSGDTITITADGSGAQAQLIIGPASGTFPSVPAYFQERRVYANTLNQPDTYFMSQPGAFTNFDARTPTIDSDAITGNPWAVEVNGIQFMVPMPGGLVVLTGLTAWQLTGTGGSSLNPQPITPSTQQAQPQAYNGCSATVPPIKIDYDIIFVQAKGSIYRQFSYQFYTNIYTGTDLTIYSSQLFTGFTIREHAWCEEPYKIIWAARDDGILLSLTYFKPQEVSGWTRSDTQGLVLSVASVTEPPVDALYMATQRFPGVHTAYMIERMDNRIWTGGVEDTWCVDCALSLPQPTPAATLTASSATGIGQLTGASAIVGGQGYSAGTTGTVVDDNGQGPGAGAVPTLTIAGGALTGVTFALGNQGTGYTFPALVISDPANSGSGASARLTLDNSATFTASLNIFGPSDVGSVIRMGGGIAVVTAFIDARHVTGNILSPIVDLIPNTAMPLPQTAGNWTLTKPVATITGLNHLIGATVTGLADGNVISPRIVQPDGSITLDAPASAVTVGLGFQAQLQSVYLDGGEPTVQGQRKKVSGPTLRIEASRGLKVGQNQPDGAAQSPIEVAPTWNNLVDVPDDGPNFPRTPYNALATPLRTGDIRTYADGGWRTPGQICVQQDHPLPMQILALIPEGFPGDTAEIKAQLRQRERRPA